MPFPNSQHPDQWGWPGPGAGPFEDFSYRGYRFPSGVAAGTSKIWTRVGDLITGAGTQLAGPTELTKATVDDYQFWGQETRQSRNSSLYSIHSWGLATDWNSGYNPNRSSSPPDGPYRLPPNLLNLLDREFGEGAFLFGGGPQGWGDWMHVELHMSPAEVRSCAGGSTTVIDTKPTPSTPKDDNDMADITDAQMDRIAQKVGALFGLDKKPRLRINDVSEDGKTLISHDVTLAEAVEAGASNAARAARH